MGGCHGSHTPADMQPNAMVTADGLLAGGVVGVRGAWGTSYPANLRLGSVSSPQKGRLAMVRPRNSRARMPCPSLRHHTDADLEALYAYITSRGPDGTPAPATLTADRSDCLRSVVFFLADSPWIPRDIRPLVNWSAGGSTNGGPAVSSPPPALPSIVPSRGKCASRIRAGMAPSPLAHHTIVV